MKKMLVILKNNLNNYRCWMISIMVLLLSLFFVNQMAWSQSEFGKTKDVKQYLMEKYKLREDEINSTLQQSSGGPSGKLRINGKITPKNVKAVEGVYDQARAIAKAFLEEEAFLFGFTNNIEEIREIGIFDGKGRQGNYTNITFRRFIDNLGMEEMYIRLRIKEGEITHVSAYLVPVPLELYEAVTKETLAEVEVRKIIEDDLKADTESPETEPFVKAEINRRRPEKIKLKKLLISSSPYVVWYGEAVWAYTIDAFSGKILKKAPTWIMN